MSTPNQISRNGQQHNAAELRKLYLENNMQTEDGLNPDELAEVLARRAFDLAQEPPVEVAGQTIDLLVFELANEHYGVNVTNVREIYPLEQLTPVPRTPNFVAGVFSARGRILSVIDLSAFLGLKSSSDGRITGQHKIIVVTNSTGSTQSGMEIGILADEVSDVTTIFKTEIEPPLTTRTSASADYVEGVTPDMLVVLDLNALFADNRLIIQEEVF